MNRFRANLVAGLLLMGLAPAAFAQTAVPSVGSGVPPTMAPAPAVAPEPLPASQPVPTSLEAYTELEQLQRDILLQQRRNTLQELRKKASGAPQQASASPSSLPAPPSLPADGGLSTSAAGPGAPQASKAQAQTSGSGWPTMTSVRGSDSALVASVTMPDGVEVTARKGDVLPNGWRVKAVTPHSVVAMEGSRERVIGFAGELPQ